MLGYIPTIDKNVLDNPLSNLNFLLGNYDVIAYSSKEHRSWVESGNGSASYSLEDKFLVEKVEIIRKDMTISMHNTIGKDFQNETFHMQTIDNTSGVMDIYKGDFNEEVLIFSNIDSTIHSKNTGSLIFKLIYKQISNSENELIVGYSRDNGKTWFPFIKNYYKKKF